MSDMSDPTYLLWAQAAKKIPEDLLSPPVSAPPAAPDPMIDELIKVTERNITAAAGWCAPAEVTYGSDSV